MKEGASLQIPGTVKRWKEYYELYYHNSQNLQKMDKFLER